MYRRVIQKIIVGFTLRGPPCISYSHCYFIELQFLWLARYV